MVSPRITSMVSPRITSATTDPPQQHITPSPERRGALLFVEFDTEGCTLSHL